MTAASQKPKLRSLISMLLKFLLAAGIISFFLWRHGSEIKLSCSSFHWRFLLPAWLCSLIPLFAGAWRWQRLVSILGIKISIVEAFMLTMEGNFFSMVLPGGAIGGDVVKIAIVSRRSADGGRTAGALSVLMDRIVGMVALFVPAMLILLCNWSDYFKTPLAEYADWEKIPATELVFMLTLICCFAGLAVTALLFANWKMPDSTRFRKFDRLCGGMLSKVIQCRLLYREHLVQLGGLTLLSLVLVHLLPALTMTIILSGFNCQANITAVAAAVLLGNLAGLLPAFPGGIGARDAITVLLLSRAAVSYGDAAAAQLICTGILLFNNLLIGGLCFIVDPGKMLNYSALRTSGATDDGK